MRLCTLWCPIAGLLVALAVGPPARGDVIYNYTASLNGESVITPAPTARFEDVAVDTVRLTLNVPYSGSGQPNAVDWYFNYTGDVGTLGIVPTSGVAPTSIETDANQLKAGGDGYYDIEIQFTPGKQLQGTAVLTLSATGLTASMFEDTSVTKKNGTVHGDFHSAVQVQNAVGEDSRWLADGPASVPLPAAAWSTLGLLGVLGMGRILRRRAD